MVRLVRRCVRYIYVNSALAGQFYFYGAGTTSRSPDLTACMAEEELRPDTIVYQDSVKQSNFLLRLFGCGVGNICQWGITATKKSTQLYNELPSHDHVRLLEILPEDAALANSAIVIWDDSEISWEWIGLAAAIIRTNLQRISASLRKDPGRHQFSPPTRRVPTGVSNAYFIYRLSKCQRYFQPVHFTFLQLLKLTRHLGCKNERDRVYGLLGLPTIDNNSNVIVPDYSKTVSQVYLEVARTLLDSSTSLAMFSSIQRERDTPSNRLTGNRYHPKVYKTNDTVPSWMILRGVRVGIVQKNFYPGFLLRGELSTTRARPSRGSLFRGEPERNLDQLLDERRYTESDLIDISVTLTAGRNWYGLPIRNMSAHLADYARCLLKEGLWWTLYGDLIGFHNSSGPDSSVCDVQEGQSSTHVNLRALEVLADGGNADRFFDAVATTCSGRKFF
ncbi:uncharacterized protein PAC_20162 [Phialocephala subalpina]|uniref:Heterokaryon incompatibility domain-containing protein n=1 Tax=Phialocephala subalpina TaxID=576137 RepID=A0A1L7XYX7_9HELO|nr:uncharacterized protein PAC_20162 [Phialocephala subalpina]